MIDEYRDECRVYAGVFAPTRPDTDTLIGLLRTATEDVLLPAVDDADSTLHLRSIRQGEDLSRGRRVHGVVWDDVARKEPLEAVIVSGFSGLRGTPVSVPFLTVHAGLPGPVRRLDGSEGQSPMVIDCSVNLSRIGGSVSAELRARLVSWLQSTAGEADAPTGYLTVDFLQAGPGATSPYEDAVMALPSERAPVNHVVGYGWGTLLGPAHVAALGGADTLQQAPVVRRVALDDDRWWLELTNDPNDLSTMTALREFLAPVLPEGLQDLEEYADEPPLRF